MLYTPFLQHINQLNRSNICLVTSVLNKLGVYPRGKNARRLKTLEVGAINTQLQRYPGLAVRAIDINSQVVTSASKEGGGILVSVSFASCVDVTQHALIEEQDFFDILPTASHDVIVCSMVSGHEIYFTL